MVGKLPAGRVREVEEWRAVVSHGRVDPVGLVAAQRARALAVQRGDGDTSPARGRTARPMTAWRCLATQGRSLRSGHKAETPGNWRFRPVMTLSQPSTRVEGGLLIAHRIA